MFAALQQMGLFKTVYFTVLKCSLRLINIENVHRCVLASDLATNSQYLGKSLSFLLYVLLVLLQY